MANFIVQKTRRVIPIAKQVHPRVLVPDYECCSCRYSDSEMYLLPGDLHCKLQDKLVHTYDECAAYESW